MSSLRSSWICDVSLELRTSLESKTDFCVSCLTATFVGIDLSALVMARVASFFGLDSPPASPMSFYLHDWSCEAVKWLIDCSVSRRTRGELTFWPVLFSRDAACLDLMTAALMLP